MIYIMAQSIKVQISMIALEVMQITELHGRSYNSAMGISGFWTIENPDTLNSKHHSSVRQKQHNNPEGEHHKNAGEKSIIMKKLHKENRHKNAPDKNIFIEMPGEVVSS
ncbi:hypothetical protein C922_05081 [Plasmodium inui San Antonio 1]|uniref:Uncharacterized protein n=1 Tax=Plasmodium inui San Antonio 1 TaxID=1237626 RepID=W7A635_9APIC|nr:hypothetical protein C922_05081 [Plasmodium inui San Antonio 1]EUD64519.1 hypothetical protein C922_05081 [Plasmodium inui San Antonio 1]